MRLKWNSPARRALRDAIIYIAQDSPMSAAKVSKRMRAKTEAAARHPLRNPPDRLKRSNDGTFRAFTSDRLRVSYRSFQDSIHIIRVRHTGRRPLKY